MNVRLAISLAAALSASTPVALHAATFTRYFDRAAFNNAAGKVALESFNTISAGTLLSTALDVGAFTIKETQFGDYGGGSRIAGGSTTGNINGTNFIAASLYDGSASYGSYLTFTFDAPITAFGGNWASGAINNIYLDVLGEKLDQNVPSTGGFFGFVSDTPFTTIVMRARASNHGAALDNLTYSVGSGAVPEPASWAMMLGGFGIVGGTLRARRKPSLTFA